MKGVFNIILRNNNSWSGVSYNMMLYVLCTTKLPAASIPDEGKSSST